MNSSGHLPVSESAARRVRKPKAQRKGRARTKSSSVPRNGEREVSSTAAPGTLTRTKSLLLAALKVWELKQRIGQ